VCLGQLACEHADSSRVADILLAALELCLVSEVLTHPRDSFDMFGKCPSGLQLLQTLSLRREGCRIEVRTQSRRLGAKILGDLVK
ncbi:hypothetical protein JTL99_36005, partial [Pseudomonas aeruginosa]|nr:hypothetical protein [Pseudomonas aeruginosa]